MNFNFDNVGKSGFRSKKEKKAATPRVKKSFYPGESVLLVPQLPIDKGYKAQFTMSDNLVKALGINVDSDVEQRVTFIYEGGEMYLLNVTSVADKVRSTAKVTKTGTFNSKYFVQMLGNDQFWCPVDSEQVVICETVAGDNVDGAVRLVRLYDNNVASAEVKAEPVSNLVEEGPVVEVEAEEVAVVDSSVDTEVASEDEDDNIW